MSAGLLLGAVLLLPIEGILLLLQLLFMAPSILVTNYQPCNITQKHQHPLLPDCSNHPHFRRGS